jgi:hypothetical protein
MPTRDHFIEDGQIFQRWLDESAPIDYLSEAACVGNILGNMRSWLMIEKGIFEFNKFELIDQYMNNRPPLVDKNVFAHMRRYLHGETQADEQQLTELRHCVRRLRTYFNRTLYGL